MKMVSILLGFGGGVLFSTTFLHLIPEVAEGVASLVESNKIPQLNFSLADMLACAGWVSPQTSLRINIKFLKKSSPRRWDISPVRHLRFNKKQSILRYSIKIIDFIVIIAMKITICIFNSMQLRWHINFTTFLNLEFTNGEISRNITFQD